MTSIRVQLIFIITIFFNSFDSIAQSESELIIGKWIGVSKVLLEQKDTVDYTLDGKGYVNNSILFFSKDGNAVVSPDQKTRYSIGQGYLRIGVRTHKVEKLTKDTLIVSSKGLTEELRFWSTFIKENKDI